MPSTLRAVFVIAIALFLSNTTNAQPRKGKFINASIGYGISAPYDETNVGGTGFYAQGEYVLGLTKWFGVRPYAGLIFTSPNENIGGSTLSEYRVSSKAFLLGGKARVCAPIPWIAPYFEVGLGASFGSFETYTPMTYKKEKGVLMHIPATIGLALGKDHNVDVAFTYYYHPSVDQFSGAAAIGIDISFIATK